MQLFQGSTVLWLCSPTTAQRTGCCAAKARVSAVDMTARERHLHADLKKYKYQSMSVFGRRTTSRAFWNL
jgi:hypothetical protein